MCEPVSVDKVLARLEQTFSVYPHRAVLEGCPHCHPSTPVDENDLYSLTISLGNTVGDRDDVKSLLPLLLERLVTDTELDPDIVLGKLPHQDWRTWPTEEQQAIDEYLGTVWRSLLAEYPSRMGAFTDVTAFLSAVLRTGEGIDRFLDVWDETIDSAADRHLAGLVNECGFSGRQNKVMTAWICREVIRDRLLAAFDRDQDAAWANDFATAYDSLSQGAFRGLG